MFDCIVHIISGWCWLLGLSPLLHRWRLACSTLWEDVVWPGTARCLIRHCLPGLHI